MRKSARFPVDAPLLAALIESLRAAGGRRPAYIAPAIRRAWSAPVSQVPTEGWQLTLVPRERALIDAVSRWCYEAPACKSPRLRSSKPMVI